MKHLSRQLALVLMLSGVGAAAPAYADFKAGFIHTDRVFREASSAKAAQAKLEQEFSRREREVEAGSLAALRASIANDDAALAEALEGPGVQVAVDKALVRGEAVLAAADQLEVNFGEKLRVEQRPVQRTLAVVYFVART